MRITKLFAFCAVLLVGVAAWSQDFPRAEVAADYSYARFYPVSRGTQSLSLNGGGGALVVNVTNYFGIKMDLQGYGSNNITWTNSAGGVLKAQGNLFTYMFGPQIKFRTPKFQPFAQWLLGARAYQRVWKSDERMRGFMLGFGITSRECFCDGDGRRYRYSHQQNIPVSSGGDRLSDDAFYQSVQQLVTEQLPIFRRCQLHFRRKQQVKQSTRMKAAVRSPWWWSQPEGSATLSPSIARF